MTRPNADILTDWDRAEDVGSLAEPFCCLTCGRDEVFGGDRCSECGRPRGESQ
jgi:hypothetical protein